MCVRVLDCVGVFPLSKGLECALRTSQMWSKFLYLSHCIFNIQIDILIYAYIIS